MKDDERKKVLELSRNWLKEDVKYNRSVQPAILHQASPRRKKVALLSSAAIIIIGIIIAVLVSNFMQSDDGQKKDTTTPQSNSLVTQRTTFSLPSAQMPSSTSVQNVSKTERSAPMANNYPSGWPEELVYPAKFSLVEANTLKVQDKYSPAYDAKMRYDGSINSTAEDFSSFFTAQGWQISERTELDSGALLIRMTKNEGRDHSKVTIDTFPGESDKVRIVATVFYVKGD